MKLLRVVNELERLRVKRADLLGAADSKLGVSWSSRDAPFAGELAPGEFLAHDITIEDFCGDVPLWRHSERVTRDRSDFGRVYDPAGAVVGDVVKVDGPLITLAISGGAGECDIPAIAERVRAATAAHVDALPDGFVPAGE